MNLEYRRANIEDINEIIFLFKNTFKRNLSKNYYLSRYFEKNKLNSFIVLFEKKIICHVGFIKNTFKVNNSKSLFVYSRHTSMVKNKFRRKGIYKNLCNFSYEILKNNKASAIITFPNKNNLKVINKKFNQFTLNKYYLLSFINNNQKQNIKHKIFNKNSLNKIFRKDQENYFFLKNKFFFIKNYLKLKNNKFYFFYKDSFFLIYNIKFLNNITNINILDHSMITKKTFLIFYTFLNSFDKKNKINIWDNNNSNKSLILKKLGFKKTNKSFIINLIPLEKNIYKSKSILDNISFTMGDTDVFHTID